MVVLTVLWNSEFCKLEWANEVIKKIAIFFSVSKFHAFYFSDSTTTSHQWWLKIWIKKRAFLWSSPEEDRGRIQVSAYSCVCWLVKVAGQVSVLPLSSGASGHNTWKNRKPVRLYYYIITYYIITYYIYIYYILLYILYITYYIITVNWSLYHE